MKCCILLTPKLIGSLLNLYSMYEQGCWQPLILVMLGRIASEMLLYRCSNLMGLDKNETWISLTCIVPCVDMVASPERSKSPTSACTQPFGRMTLWYRLRSCISGQSCILSCRGRWCCVAGPQTSCKQSYRHLVRKHSWVSLGCC